MMVHEVLFQILCFKAILIRLGVNGRNILNLMVQSNSSYKFYITFVWIPVVLFSMREGYCMTPTIHLAKYIFYNRGWIAANNVSIHADLYDGRNVGMNIRRKIQFDWKSFLFIWVPTQSPCYKSRQNTYNLIYTWYMQRWTNSRDF